MAFSAAAVLKTGFTRACSISQSIAGRRMTNPAATEDQNFRPIRRHREPHLGRHGDLAHGRRLVGALSDAPSSETPKRRGRCSAKAIADDVGAIGSYIAPVQVESDGAIAPGNLREHIRHDGVTIELLDA